MNINKLSKEAHENAIEKSFYDCPECGGVSGYPRNKKNINRGEKIKELCTSCNGTGIDQNKNIPELLMLVITEIGEAVEALRCGRFATYFSNRDISKYNFERKAELLHFKKYIKDTFEDEIADVFIRLFDLCGYLGIEIDESEIMMDDIIHSYDSKLEWLFRIIKIIINYETYYNEHITTKRNKAELNKSNMINSMHFLISELLIFCNTNKIDIERHITAKMQYNKTRPKKHGKEF